MVLAARGRGCIDRLDRRAVYRETFNIRTHQDANEAHTIMIVAREDASEGSRPLPRSLFKSGL